MTKAWWSSMIVPALFMSPGCGPQGSPDSPAELTAPITPTGRIQVTTKTTGSWPDPHGYSLTIDGRLAGSLGLSTTQIFDGIHPGQHEVALASLSQNCGVTGSNPLLVAVSADGTSSVSFEVACAADDNEAFRTGIAFMSHRDGHQPEIYVMDPDGSDPTRLTNDDLWSAEPTWSPSGTHIAYNNGGDIYVARADGSDPVRLTGRGFDHLRDFETVDQLKGPQDADHLKDFEDWEPAWSPDGTHIAFARDVTGWWELEIYVMEADGTNPVRLTFGNGGTGPAWSPDGTRIADGWDDVYVMNADGSDRVNLTNDGAYNYFPAWSPDGTKIAFVSARDGNAEVYVMDADGSNPVNLTNHPSQDSTPTWSPDGTRIAFSTNRDGNGEVYLMDVDGSSLVNLTNHPASDWAPTWW